MTMLQISLRARGRFCYRLRRPFLGGPPLKRYPFPLGGLDAGGEIIRGGGSVLQLSMRRVHDLVAFCLPYEFEDVIAQVTGADRVELADYEAVEQARRFYKLGRLATGSAALARRLAPKVAGPRLDREYELFLPVFNHAYELFALAALPGWRDRCKRAACFISELYVEHLPSYLLETLHQFEQVFVGVQNPVRALEKIVGRPVAYLPLAADVLRFAPSGEPRSIDVCNIGRRSPVTHAALIRMARERRIFYYYDTVRASGPGGKQMTFSVGNASEHRLLLASLLQHSRIYLAHRSRVNEPDMNPGTPEISGRFYEGTAAGAILVGEPPASEEFRRQFDWEGAVTQVPFDSPEAKEIAEVLGWDVETTERIRRANVRNSALRHDWVHRLRTIFDRLGLPPTQAMLAREEQLRGLAASLQ
jgi:hypothetical protein